MKIGEVAERRGVNLQTIRYYEREGLLQEPPRLATGCGPLSDCPILDALDAKGVPT